MNQVFFTQREERGVFSFLPDELVLKIFSYVPVFHIAQCASVCRRWRKLCYKKDLWIRVKAPKSVLSMPLYHLPLLMCDLILVRGKDLDRGQMLLSNIVHDVRLRASSRPFLQVVIDVLGQVCGLESIHVNVGSIGSVVGCRLLESLRTCTQLQRVYLGNCPVGERGAEAVAFITRRPYSVLQEICLPQCALRRKGAEIICRSMIGHPYLRTFRIPNNDIGDDGAERLVEVIQDPRCQLRTIELYRNGIGPFVCEGLAQAIGVNQSLEYLSLAANDVRGVGAAMIFRSLQHNSTLTTLSLVENEIDGEGLTPLQDSLRTCKLCRLFLGGNPLGVMGSKSLAEGISCNSTLKELSIHSCGLGDEGTVALCNALCSPCCIVESLWLSHNNIRDCGVQALGALLKRSRTLKSLVVSGNMLKKGFSAFQDGLIVCRSLRKLDVSSSRLGIDECLLLAQAIRRNKTLLSVDMSSNYLGDRGAEVLASCLVESNVQHIDASDCHVGVKGGIAIANALNATQLQRLQMKNNRLERAGIHLAHALCWNSTLTELDVGSNDLGPGEASAFSECMQQNKGLRILIMNKNPFGEESVHELSVALKSASEVLESVHMLSCGFSQRSRAFLKLSTPSHVKLSLQ